MPLPDNDVNLRCPLKRKNRLERVINAKTMLTRQKMDSPAFETMSGNDGDNRGQAEAQTRDVTQLLRAWSEGDQEALERLTPLVYQELHRRAHRQMAQERSGQTLQTTALVNEIYLQLIDLRGVSWRDRAHFFALSSRLIRRVLIDAARARRSLKRGAGSPHVEFDENLLISTEPRADVLALDEALTALATLDQRKSEVVELRFFGGLGIEEVAEVLKVSPETVKRDWKLAKAWLRRELRRDKSSQQIDDRRRQRPFIDPAG
jgi:RNA polymerase sigma factor (TIGR02999 family)